MDNPQLLAAGTFIVVAAAILGAYYAFVLRDESAEQRLIRQRIRTGGAPRRTADTGGGLLKEAERFSAIGPLNQLLGGQGRFALHLRDVIHFSGVKVTPGQIVLGSACLALLAYVLVAMRTGLPLLGAVCGVVAAFVPYVVLRVLRARRLGRFEEQFPEAVDLIARTLRAGHAFTTGLRIAADELAQPVAGEFKLLYDQQNYGLPLPDALRHLARRVPIIDARFFVTAVLTQREAGGNLAEVLDNLSAVTRERFRVRRQLRVISAHGRLTGVVLALLPPVLAAFMLIRSPEHFSVLLEDPLGIRLIVGAVGLQLLGAFLIYKITNVEY